MIHPIYKTQAQQHRSINNITSMTFRARILDSESEGVQKYVISGNLNRRQNHCGDYSTTFL